MSSVQLNIDIVMQWGAKIPMRDGTMLNATIYRPRSPTTIAPAIVTLTPYVGQLWHDQAVYFASHGFPFLCVDTRGRGNSEGVFDPLINEGTDGHDVVEWTATQSFCDGQVAMWGGSYAGHDQWNTARTFPSHLKTIAPVASPFVGVDFPARKHIVDSYLMQWLTLVAGRTLQDRVFFENSAFWGDQFRQWFESGLSFAALDDFLAHPSPIFQRWLAKCEAGDSWDNYNPTAAEYARLDLPILTITGACDGNQPGAITHYRAHRDAAPNAPHFLVIGPWDHAGTRVPQLEFGGLRCGPASLVDLQRLHLDWYRWTMLGEPKPAFLKANIAYYVMEADVWCYADALDAVTSHHTALHLHSTVNPVDVFASGALVGEAQALSGPDHYVYDPANTSHAIVESDANPESRVDQRVIHAKHGRQLIYHSPPFENDTEITGFFRLTLWMAIDQPDTDFAVSVHEIALDGSSVLLSNDMLRARFANDPQKKQDSLSERPGRYLFDGFPFISRLMRKGHRLRLVIGPIDSIYWQRNPNTGGEVASATLAESRQVTVTVFHDQQFPSVLEVPIGHPGLIANTANDQGGLRSTPV